MSILWWVIFGIFYFLMGCAVAHAEAKDEDNSPMSPVTMWTIIIGFPLVVVYEIVTGVGHGLYKLIVPRGKRV